MKIKFLFLLTFAFLGVAAPKSSQIIKIKNSNSFDGSTIYIFCRGSLSKSSLIAHTFNYSDTNITHVGIGYYSGKRFYIYNVSDVNTVDKGFFRIDSLQSFLASDDIYFFSLWKYKTNLKVIENLKNICNSYRTKEVVFDNFFELKKNDTLYCSEFCANVLSSLNMDQLKFAPRHLKLKNELYKVVLKREIFSYFPVDFFQTNNSFKKIYSSKIEKN